MRLRKDIKVIVVTIATITVTCMVVLAKAI